MITPPLDSPLNSSPGGHRRAEQLHDTEKIKLLVNGKPFAEQTRDDHVFTFRVPLTGDIRVEAISGKYTDSATFRKVDHPNPDYVLKKVKNRQKSTWVDA